MLTAVLKNKSTAVKITVKGAISVLMIVLAVALPQIAHIAGGAAAGAVYLPSWRALSPCKFCVYLAASGFGNARRGKAALYGG